MFGDRRLPNLPKPKVLMLSELGLKGFNDQPYVGMLVPKGTPQAAVQRLNQALNEAIGQLEVKNQMQALGLTVAPGTPEEFLKETKADFG
ncbi:Tripartite tricarboxylate transporter family receptor [compost metagenome]